MGTLAAMISTGDSLPVIEPLVFPEDVRPNKIFNIRSNMPLSRPENLLRFPEPLEDGSVEGLEVMIGD